VSDNVLRVIPEDPARVPSALAREAAVSVLRRALPRADDVASELTEDVRFVDCGVNFEAVRCPGCGTDLGEWWTLAMEVAHEERFADLRITTPCCKLWTSLNDLGYSWPVGFARFTLEALNPDVENLPDAVRLRLEHILGSKVRLIWAHY
jgi:hypothetical protein